MENTSNAAAILGSIKSAKKAASSRENGKLGGRPKTSRLQQWYNEQRKGRGAWAESDYELAAALDNGDIGETPDWLHYNGCDNTIYDEDCPHIVIWL